MFLRITEKKPQDGSYHLEAFTTLFHTTTTTTTTAHLLTAFSDLTQRQEAYLKVEVFSFML